MDRVQGRRAASGQLTTMSWTRLDDRWTERSVFDTVSLASRWHYLSLVQVCCRTDRVDGRLTTSAALRASDVDDPAGALAELVSAGLVEPVTGGFRLPHIAEHVPPEQVRNRADQAKLRQRRSRAHHAGDHATCRPDHCDDAAAPVTPHVTRDQAHGHAFVTPAVTNVTRDTGTGRDGTGQGTTQLREPQEQAAVCVTCGRPADMAIRGRCRSCHFAKSSRAG